MYRFDRIRDKPMAKKTIIVLCGSGVASSAMAASKLEQLCEERGLDVKIEKRAYRDMKGIGAKPALIVALTPGLKAGGFGIGFDDVPVVMGVSLLTGRGYEKIIDEIEKELKEDS
jgi:PTS system galactitol-specific IIB component